MGKAADSTYDTLSYAVQRPIVLGAVTVEVGVGVVLCATEVSIDSLLEQSDAALYAAKAAGRVRSLEQVANVVDSGGQRITDAAVTVAVGG